MANEKLVVVDDGVAAAQRSAMQEVYGLMARIAASDAALILVDLASAVARALALANRRDAGHKAIVPAPHAAHGQSSDTIAVPLAGNLHRMERFIIDEVLQRCRGNKAAAARMLGLHRRTLYRILERADSQECLIAKDEGGRQKDEG
jgi:transcriptional regulator with GAF, ATPase, and Fis domain